MPGHLEVETRELQAAISEHVRAGWLEYVALTTALLAVFAAVAALQATSLVNEGMMSQIKASDTWAEFQASREKYHLYSVALDGILDREVATPSRAAAARATQYRAKIADEVGKQLERSAEARRLENESAAQLHKQHYFEYSVGLIQVAIALSAVAALAKVKPVWYVGLVAGAGGIGLFAAGFLA